MYYTYCIYYLKPSDFSLMLLFMAKSLIHKELPVKDDIYQD